MTTPTIGPYANLKGADLEGADFRGADLEGADFRGANLRGANLRGANLRWADLADADLSGADLYGTRLYGASLYGASLCGATVNSADLRGANLRDADLRQVYGLVHGWSQYYWLGFRDPEGSLWLSFGCEAHKLSDWQHDAAAALHHPTEVSRYAALTRAAAATVQAFFSEQPK